jgi:hypothetical protein
VTFCVDEDLADALKVIKERDGIPEASSCGGPSGRGSGRRTWESGNQQDPHVLGRPAARRNDDR